MNYLDFVVIILLAIFAIRGLFRGLITELFILIALVAGFVLAFLFLDAAVQLLMNFFPGIPEFAARILSFLSIFLGINIAVRITAKMLNKFITITFLQPVNRLAGAVFGFTKMAILLSISFLIIDLLPVSGFILTKIGADQSVTYGPVKNVAPAIYGFLTSVLPGSDAIKERFMHMFHEADSSVKDMLLQ